MNLFFDLALLAVLSHGASANVFDDGAVGVGRGPPAIKIPPVDRSKVDPEDAAREARGMPPRFAIPNDVSVNPNNGDGSVEVLADGTTVWQVRIRSPGAHSLNLGFTSYDMPKGGELRILRSKGKDGGTDAGIGRAFTHADNAAHGELWTPVVLADDVVIEARLPAGVGLSELQLALAKVNVGYRGFGRGLGGGPPPRALRGESRPLEQGHGLEEDDPLALFPFEDQDRRLSGSCNVDVICDEGGAWVNEIPSVGAYSVRGSLACTGALVNNVLQDKTPYFLTADHCGIKNNNAASVVVYWNYETTECGGAPDGQLNQFTSGAFFRAGWSSSDFTLIELDANGDDLVQQYGVSFAGWDNTGDMATSAVAIHHPGVDEKRISFDFDSTRTGSLSNHVYVDDWDLGTTEPGSSGSPLFDQNHRVIGQLHGGSAACGNDLEDYYGQLSASWNGGGSASSRLKDWLDPLDTGTATLDTLSDGTNRPTASPTASSKPTSSPAPTVDMILTCGEVVTDSTAGLDPISMPNCGTSDGSGGAVWYKLVGAVGPTTLSTCGGQTSYDTKVRVYRNNKQTCVAGNDDDNSCPNYQTTVDFDAEQGVDYDVLIHGYNNAEGTFTLTVDCTSVLTGAPTKMPTGAPTKAPNTSMSPTGSPTTTPSKAPTSSPTSSPSKAPTDSPTSSPSKAPTDSPTSSPSKTPTNSPSASPSKAPTSSPTSSPSKTPTKAPSPPTDSPSGSPSKGPTLSPTAAPTKNPTAQPTNAPIDPTLPPSAAPTQNPTAQPTGSPTTSPSKNPTSDPTPSPTLAPTQQPTAQPTGSPTTSPSKNPTGSPSASPSKSPSPPTDAPTHSPTNEPTTTPPVDCSVLTSKSCKDQAQCQWFNAGRGVKCCLDQNDPQPSCAN